MSIITTAQGFSHIVHIIRPQHYPTFILCTRLVCMLLLLLFVIILFFQIFVIINHVYTQLYFFYHGGLSMQACALPLLAQTP